MTYAFHFRQNSETFDILHVFLSSVVAKLCDLKKQSGFFWPTLYFANQTFFVIPSVPLILLSC